jgi:hypothetical protein
VLVLLTAFGYEYMTASAMAEQAEPPARRESTGAPVPNDSAIATRDECILAARQLLGLLDEPVTISASLEHVVDDETPFLKENIRGKLLWHVVIAKWRFRLPSMPFSARDDYERTVDVLLQPSSGSVLSVVSRWPDGVPPIAPEPTASIAEARMQDVGEEKYHGFVNRPPTISLMKALDIILKDGVGNPLSAKQIIARHVRRSFMGREPRDVWAITLRGIPPLETRAEVTIDAINHIRNVIDAETGEWLWAGTSPQPDAPPASGK